MTTATPFLMFEGRAEEAMAFYVSLFEDGEVLQLTRWGERQPGREGKLMLADFKIAGQTVRCNDSPVGHAFTFTPSISLFVDCDDLAQFERLVAALAQGGSLLMEPADYGFSRRFAWLQDRFGVSWQVNLP